jgi:hypothetical protein
MSPGGHITRSEEPLEELMPFEHNFTGRVDYGLTTKAVQELGGQ